MIALGGIELCRMLFAIPQEPNDLRLGWIFKGDVQRHVGGRACFPLANRIRPWLSCPPHRRKGRDAALGVGTGDTPAR
jgi:hypothetical protein